VSLIDTLQVGDEEKQKGSILTPADDPENRCAALRGHWKVTDKLQIGRLLDNGETVQCSALALSEGDFVDVGLTFDVAMTKSANGQRRVRVFLLMEHVLQLLPNRRVTEVSNYYRQIVNLTNTVTLMPGYYGSQHLDKFDGD